MGPLVLLTRHYLRLIYRDRNTKLYCVLLPLMLYPCMLLLAGQGRLVLQGLEQARPSRVALALPESSAPAESTLAGALAAPQSRLDLVHWPGQGLEAGEELLARGAAEAVLTSSAPGGPLLLLRREEDPASLRAASRVRTLVASLHGGSDTPAALPVRVIQARATPDLLGLLLARILPMIVLVTAALGALYPAVEVTAGQRERKTVETTLLLPIPLGLATTARFLAVGLAGSGAVLLNLAGMVLTAGPLLGGSGALLAGLSPSTLAVAGTLGILLALLFAATLLLACTPARTFREAQAYSAPITLLAFLPGLAPLLPGLEFGYVEASLPLINAALALQHTLQGTATLGPTLLTTGQLALLTLVLTSIAARLQDRPERERP